MNTAKIIAITQPLIEHDSNKMSSEEFIAYTARVSNPSNQHNKLTAPKLLKYLIDHKHWSPFEMVSVTMDIETTRDIAHQIVRHRSFSFQEFSQRYADPTKDMGFITREARLQDVKNRQNSIDTEDEPLCKQWNAKQMQQTHEAGLAYKWAIENGIAKEQARAVLPEGMTVSRLYMNGTLRSWVHYIHLRTEKGTQEEHRMIAALCGHAIEEIFPMMGEFIHEQ